MAILICGDKTKKTLKNKKICLWIVITLALVLLPSKRMDLHKDIYCLEWIVRQLYCRCSSIVIALHQVVEMLTRFLPTNIMIFHFNFLLTLVKKSFDNYAVVLSFFFFVILETKSKNLFANHVEKKWGKMDWYSFKIISFYKDLTWFVLISNQVKFWKLRNSNIQVKRTYLFFLNKRCYLH